MKDIDSEPPEGFVNIEKGDFFEDNQKEAIKLVLMSLYNQGGGSNRNQLLAQLGEIWISHIDGCILRMERQTDDKLEELWEAEIEESCDPYED